MGNKLQVLFQFSVLGHAWEGFVRVSLIGYLKDFDLFQLGEMVGPEKIQKSNMCGVPRFPDIVTSGYSEKTTHVM